MKISDLRNSIGIASHSPPPPAPIVASSGNSRFEKAGKLEVIGMQEMGHLSPNGGWRLTGAGVGGSHQLVVGGLSCLSCPDSKEIP